MYWLLNIVTGAENEPQAVLIRGIAGYNGPEKLARIRPEFKNGPRIGINYAGDIWKKMPWRYFVSSP